MCFDAPKLLDGLNYEAKGEAKREGIRTRSLAYCILRVEGCVGALGWD